MRRVLAPVLAFLGSLLLVFGLLAWLWIGPAVRKAPIDQQSRTISTGSGTYYDFGSGEQVESGEIESVINTQSDQSVYEGEDPISDDIAVYDQTSGLFDRATGTEITYSDSRIAIDRVTALPVSCCGADEEIEGLTIKWPFGAEQGDYPLWDGTLGAEVTATYEGREEIEGLTVYRYDVEVPPTNTGPATPDNEFPTVMYESTKSYWVEPVTGRIIDSTQDVHRYVVDENGETVIDAADVSLNVSPETVSDSVALAKDQVSQLGLVDLMAWVGPLVGLLLILVAFLMRRREDEDDVVADDAPADDAPAHDARTDDARADDAAHPTA